MSSAANSWGILINPDKSPAPLLEQLCLGIAQLMVRPLFEPRPHVREHWKLPGGPRFTRSIYMRPVLMPFPSTTAFL